MMQQVWVAYVGEKQHLIALNFVEGMTAQEAVIQSGLPQLESLVEPYQLGIFGVKVAADYVLKQGDRVEVYRPLKINPKDIRRNRAEKNPTSRYLQKQRARGNRFRHEGDSST